MGCCESCAVPQPTETEPPPYFCLEEASWQPSAPASLQPSPRSSLHSLLDPLSPQFEDATAREIASLVETLEERRDWKVHTQDSVCVIKSLAPGNCLRSKTPVFSVEVHFDSAVPRDQVLQVLYSPPIRLRWDPEVLLMEEREIGTNIWLVYSVTKLPFPFKSRDFSERRILVEGSEAAVVIQYSVGPDKGGWETTNRFERAEEHFSLTKVEQAADMTTIQITSQCDLKLPVTLSQVAPQAALRMKNWAYQLHKEVTSSFSPYASLKSSPSSYIPGADLSPHYCGVLAIENVRDKWMITNLPASTLTVLDATTPNSTCRDISTPSI